MSEPLFSEINQENNYKWDRRFISMYWALIFSVLSVFVLYDLIQYYFYSIEDKHYSFTSLFINITIALFLEVGYRKRVGGLSYAVIIGNILMCSTLILAHPDIIYIEMSLVMPIFLSALYYNKKIINTAFMVSITSFFLIYFSNETIQQRNSTIDIIYIIIIFSMTSYISYIVNIRGNELLKGIQNAMQRKQDLLIQNILIEQASRRDALTNLFNHGCFHQYLESLIEQNKSHDLPLQLAILDIDNFKSVNDTYGHGAGDEVLKKVSEVLLKHCSTEDFTARYGGEEFAILFVDKSIEDAYLIMESIRKEVEEMDHEELGSRKITVSVGLRGYKKNESKTNFFDQTDKYLYKAKNSGKNKIVYK